MVIMEKDHYLKMVYDQLNDRAIYKKVDSKHDKKVMTFLRKFISKYDHVLTEKEKDYLVNFTPKKDKQLLWPSKSPQIKNNLRTDQDPKQRIHCSTTT